MNKEIIRRIDTEMGSHLGYSRHQRNNSSNARNGYIKAHYISELTYLFGKAFKYKDSEI